MVSWLAIVTTMLYFRPQAQGWADPLPNVPLDLIFPKFFVCFSPIERRADEMRFSTSSISIGGRVTVLGELPLVHSRARSLISLHPRFCWLGVPLFPPSQPQPPVKESYSSSCHSHPSPATRKSRELRVQSNCDWRPANQRSHIRRQPFWRSCFTHPLGPLKWTTRLFHPLCLFHLGSQAQAHPTAQLWPGGATIPKIDTLSCETPDSKTLLCLASDQVRQAGRFLRPGMTLAFPVRFVSSEAQNRRLGTYCSLSPGPKRGDNLDLDV